MEIRWQQMKDKHSVKKGIVLNNENWTKRDPKHHWRLMAASQEHKKHNWMANLIAL